MWADSEQLGAARGCLELLGAVRGSSELFWAARSCSELFGAARSCSGLLGAARGCSGLVGAAHRCSRYGKMVRAEEMFFNGVNPDSCTCDLSRTPIASGFSLVPNAMIAQVMDIIFLGL